MPTPRPDIGAWYETVEGEMLEVVAYDRDEGTIEVQFYDGTVDEFDEDSWDEMTLRPGEPPEDWSGSLDVRGDDYGVDLDHPAGETFGNPLDDIDKED